MQRIMKEHKPCPFCGNNNLIYVNDNEFLEIAKHENNYDSNKYSTNLDEPGVIICSTLKFGCGVTSGAVFNLDGGLEWWNKRSNN